MRVITWNVRRAKADDVAWEMLLDMEPDIALLQEVSIFPPTITSSFDVKFESAVGKTGKPQKFGTAVLVRGKIIDDLQLSSAYDWVNSELNFFAGNLVGCTILTEDGSPKNVISVHSPAWPINKDRLANVDVSDVKLKYHTDVWCTEILWAALKHTMADSSQQWIVGGDFNSSETFDWKDGSSRGNGEILGRMNALGLTECLREYHGQLTPTFKNSRGGKVVHQLDHMFVSGNLKQLLKQCITGDASKVFGDSISDHLPVIGDFYS